MKLLKRIIVFALLLSGLVFLDFPNTTVEASPVLGTNTFSSVTSSMYTPFRIYDFGQQTLAYSSSSRLISIQNNQGVHPDSTWIRSGHIQNMSTYGGIYQSKGSAMILRPDTTSKSAEFSVFINDLPQMSKIELSFSTTSQLIETNIKTSPNASLRLYYLDMVLNDFVDISGNLVPRIKNNSYSKVSINVNGFGVYRLVYDVPNAVSTKDYRLIIDDINIYVDRNPLESNLSSIYFKTETDDIIQQYFGKNQSPVDSHMGKIRYSEYSNDYDLKIINIIPKDFFFAEGTFGYVGKEWGFVTSTSKSGNLYYTNLLIFDITRLYPGYSVKADDLEFMPLETGVIKTSKQSLTQVTMVLNTTIISYEEVYDYRISWQRVTGGGYQRFSNYNLNVEMMHELINYNNPLIGTTDSSKAYIQQAVDITASVNDGVHYDEVWENIHNGVMEFNKYLGVVNTATSYGEKIGIIQEIPYVNIGVKIMTTAEKIAAFAKNVTKTNYTYMSYIFGKSLIQPYERLTSWHYNSTVHNINKAGDYFRNVLTLSDSNNETTLITKFTLKFNVNGTLFNLVSDDRYHVFDTFRVNQNALSPYSNQIKTSYELRNTHYTFTPIVTGYYTFIGHENASLTVKNQSFKQLFYDNGIRQGYEFDDVGDMIFVDVYIKPQTTLYLVAGQTYYISMKNRSTYSSFVQYNPNKIQVIVPFSGGSGGGGGGGGGPVFEFQ